MNDLKYFGAHLSLSFQTHVVRKILRKRFYFPSALVVCVSHPRFENRLACDCLCHFVKKNLGVIFWGRFEKLSKRKLQLWWRHSIFADVSASGPWRHPLKFAQLLPSLLFSLHMFICLSLLTLNIKKLHFYEVCTRHRREPPPSRNDYCCGVCADYVDIWHAWMTLSTN